MFIKSVEFALRRSRRRPTCQRSVMLCAASGVRSCLRMSRLSKYSLTALGPAVGAGGSMIICEVVKVGGVG